MSPRLPKAPYIKTSVAALIVALVIAVSAFVRAVRIAPVEAGPPATDAELVRATSTPTVPGVDIEAVGANDIFQSDRKAPPSRYRMPGESGPESPAATAESPKPVVLGTVVSTDGQHFATCQLPGERPTIVHVGEKLGAYTVVSIDRLKVVFKTHSGALLEIAALRPGNPSP
jgi:hypothetical protein